MNEKNKSLFPVSTQMILGGLVFACVPQWLGAGDIRVAAGLIVGAIFFVGGVMLKELGR